MLLESVQRNTLVAYCRNVTNNVVYRGYNRARSLVYHWVWQTQP